MSLLLALLCWSEPTVTDRLKNEGLKELHAYKMLEELCTVAPHRLAGSKGEERAIRWALDTMKEIGLQNVRLEKVMVPHWDRGSIAKLRFADEKLNQSMSLPILALGGSVATPKGGITAEVVMVSSFEELDQLGEKVRGKIVFYNVFFDETLISPFQAYGQTVKYRSQGASRAAKHGAVGTIVRSMTHHKDDFPHTGGMRYAEDVEKIPTAAVSYLGADRLAFSLKNQPDLKLHFEMDCQTYEDKESGNVVGEIIGTDKADEILVVGGHLDAWDVGQGAHDDGTGCAQSLEVASLLLRLNLKPRRTIRVVLFANEENGVRGGRTYAETHESKMDKHMLAMESDRGGFTPRGFTTNAPKEFYTAMAPVMKELETIGAGFLTRGYGGVDIAPMQQFGVLQVGYLPDVHRYFEIHHSQYDTLERVNPRELQLGAVAMASFLYHAANLETIR